MAVAAATFGNMFTFKECYPYNKESFAFIDCVLLRQVGDKLAVGTLIPEAIVNIVKSKIKFNVGESLFVIPLACSWTADVIEEKSSDIVDSDFDHDDDSDDSDDDGDSSDSDDSGSEDDSEEDSEESDQESKQ
jgi:hypothetical protein